MLKLRFFISPFVILVLIFLTIYSKAFTSSFYSDNLKQNLDFNGAIALENAFELLSMGPRTPGGIAHSLFYPWVRSKILHPGWIVETQEGNINDHYLINVIAKNSTLPPKIIIAAHYDSRLVSDNDSDPLLRLKPVPGANDGASGVALLIELARTIPDNSVPIWLVFLDAEDNGNIPGWEWSQGSRYFVSKLETSPRAAIILDMVGDKDLNIYREINSNIDLANEIWETAKLLGYEKFFIDATKYSIIDDHIPFIEAGIPAVDIIDFDYPYWHTSSDTKDKISAESLQVVGSTILEWINQQK